MAKKQTKKRTSGVIYRDPKTGTPIVTMYNTDAEIRKVVAGKPTLATVEFLVDYMAPYYFEARKREAGQDGEQKDVSELERLFNLEDPRGR